MAQSVGDAQGTSVTEAKVLTYKGRRYDLGRWLARHPGGTLPFEYFLGTDATVPMHMFHDMASPLVSRWLEKLDIGPDPDHPPSEFDRDYLELEQLFVERGWFAPSSAWFIYKTTLVVAYLVGALILPQIWLKGLLLGLFVHQSAFLAHDTCHDAAFPRKIRDQMAWFFGSVCFGLNHEKWTREHNLHHLVNNRPLIDPQINNMPDLLYSFREVESFEREKRPLERRDKRMMGYAHIWLLPVLFLYGRLNAMRSEIRRARRSKSYTYLKGVALHALILSTVIGIAIGQNGASSWLPSLIVIPLLSLGLSGTLHLQLILSHGYRPRLYEEEQRHLGMKIQIISNQNVTAGFLTAWFHGGLENHIEHHLFPRIPRHNLPKIRPYVKELCKKHDLAYNTAPFFKCVWDFLCSLKRESAPLRAELSKMSNVAEHSTTI